MQRELMGAGIMAVVGVVLLLTMGTAPLPAPARRAPLTPAAAVTAYIQSAVSPRVVAVEAAVATIDWQVDSQGGVLQGNSAMVRALTQQARTISAASHEFATLVPPWLGLLPTVHLQCLLEDLAVLGDHLAGLLHAAAAPVTTSDYLAAAANVAYWPRVREAVALLRRAEGWLVVIDGETGAHVFLPGFALGAPPLESQLYVR